jgi:hypothetical protein
MMNPELELLKKYSADIKKGNLQHISEFIHLMKENDFGSEEYISKLIDEGERKYLEEYPDLETVDGRKYLGASIKKKFSAIKMAISFAAHYTNVLTEGFAIVYKQEESFFDDFVKNFNSNSPFVAMYTGENLDFIVSKGKKLIAYGRANKNSNDIFVMADSFNLKKFHDMIMHYELFDSNGIDFNDCDSLDDMLKGTVFDDVVESVYTVNKGIIENEPKMLHNDRISE